MRLVGATNWRIRVPFLIEGLVEALVGATLAIIGLFLIKVLVIDQLRGKVAFLPLIRNADVLCDRAAGSSSRRSPSRSSPARSGCAASSTSSARRHGSARRGRGDGRRLATARRGTTTRSLERFEGGIMLTGDEVKSLRAGRASLDRGVRARPRRRGLARGDAHPAVRAGRHEARTCRCGPRKLLLHRREIDAIWPGQRPRSGCPWSRCACTSPTAWRRWSSALGRGQAPVREAAVDREARRPSARWNASRRPPPLAASAGVGARPYTSGGQLHMGVYWLRLGRCTVWEKRAVIPDVT